MIAIIDYGMGNIHSVQKALESLGGKTAVVRSPEDIRSCDKVVLPGVGAFDDAVSELEKSGMSAAIKEHIKQKKVFLGICLGLQLLFEASEEAVQKKGLGILKGSVKRFKEQPGLKVPHMGWNQLRRAPGDQGIRGPAECPLLKDVPDGSYVYFCHSYYPQPADKNVVAAATDYGTAFASVVWQGTVFGAQFHPEKSQETGVRILKNFVGL